jgi:hypothetical protein
VTNPDLARKLERRQYLGDDEPSVNGVPSGCNTSIALTNKTQRNQTYGCACFPYSSTIKLCSRLMGSGSLLNCLGMAKNKTMQGPQGILGPPAPAGPRGAAGKTGTRGTTGKAGAIGAVGKTGATPVEPAGRRKVIREVDRHVDNIYRELGVHLKRMGQIQRQIDDLRAKLRTTGIGN